MTPIFYSLPPAGNKVLLTTIVNAVKSVGDRSKVEWFGFLQGFLGSHRLFHLSSGRAALWLILKSQSELRPHKREVIIPAYTCPAVASAVLRAGLQPILADINLTDFGFSNEDLNRKITSNTLAVIVVHLFGYPANLGEVYEFCKQHDVFLVEDAAQAFGNTVFNSPDKKLGLLGDAGFFSFGRGKPLSVMHGGILVTSSEEIYQGAKKIYGGLNHSSKFQDLKYFFMVSSYSVFSNPYLYWIPQRMPFLHLGETSFEADFVISRGVDSAGSIINKMVSFLGQNKDIRSKNSSWYAENLKELPFVQKSPLPSYPYLRYPFMVEHNGLRDCILENLISLGTGAALFYPSPLNELPGLKEILQDGNSYPNSKKLSKTLITLPVHAGVKQSDRERIKSTIQKIIESEGD